MRKKIIYSYKCIWCFFNIDNKQKIEEHCLKFHGITGKFSKGYKTTKKYTNKKERIEL